MGHQLQLGSYYGAVQQQQCCAGAVMTAVHHGKARDIPRHSHEAAFFAFITRGHYREQFMQGKMLEYKPFTVGYHPPGLMHKDELGTGGVDFFNVEISPTFFKRNSEYLPLDSVKPGLHGSELAILTTRLYAAFQIGDATPLATESLVLEMFAKAAELNQINEAPHPRWLDRTLEVLHARYHEPLTVHEVAREAEVHPVHLSRVFRSRHKQTLGEYVNKVRVRQAIASMREGEELAAIASQVGFFDQSHFNRVFKQITGSAPAKFREMMNGKKNGSASYFDFSIGRSSRAQSKNDASYMLTA